MCYILFSLLHSKTVAPSLLHPHVICLCSLSTDRNFYLEGEKGNNKELNICVFGRNLLHQNFFKKLMAYLKYLYLHSGFSSECTNLSPFKISLWGTPIFFLYQIILLQYQLLVNSKSIIIQLKCLKLFYISYLKHGNKYFSVKNIYNYTLV